jgi:phosphatidylglycerol lysyltransferase
LLNELKTVSDEWLTMTRGSEMRFSLGWFNDDYVRNSGVAAARAAEGHISAFANIVPEYQHNEVSLDLMRRKHQIENGTMDFLFASLFEWAKQKGIRDIQPWAERVVGDRGKVGRPRCRKKSCAS